MNKEESISMRYNLLAEKMIKSLERRGYEAIYCQDKEETVKHILSTVPCGSSVTWGGSVTLNEIGIKEALKQSDYVIIDRDTAKSEEEKFDMMRQAFSSDVYLSSVNAMSEDGEMVNIDAVGNRVAAIAFGSKKVILVVGMNKVCKDLDDAKRRARTYAAPVNGIRLALDVPCTKTGSCFDCKNASSMCAQMMVMRTNCIQGRTKVILVGEELGI